MSPVQPWMGDVDNLSTGERATGGRSCCWLPGNQFQPIEHWPPIHALGGITVRQLRASNAVPIIGPVRILGNRFGVEASNDSLAH
jgi:hypothetical protein